MLANELDYVLGVDTHRDEHVIAVVTAPAGAVVAGSAAPRNGRGYRELLRVAARHAPGRRAWAIEGTGSYGAGLARFLAGRGETVLELSRTPRAEGGCGAKTTSSTRSEPHAPRSPARRSPCHAQASNGKRYGCCWSRGAVPSTSDVKLSRSSAP
jgi:hypothetical protein